MATPSSTSTPIPTPVPAAADRRATPHARTGFIRKQQAMATRRREAHIDARRHAPVSPPSSSSSFSSSLVQSWVDRRPTAVSSVWTSTEEGRYMARALHDYAREPAVALVREREAAAASSASSEPTPPTPHSSPSSLAAPLPDHGLERGAPRAADIQPFMDAYMARYGQASTGNTDVAAVIGRHVEQVAVYRSQQKMDVHQQMLGPACYSMSAPAQTWEPRVYVTPKADAAALPDNRKILIYEDMTEEERRKYGIQTNTADAAGPVNRTAELAPVGALRLPAEPPRLASLPEHGLERGASRTEMTRYASRRVLKWMLAEKGSRPVEFQRVASCAVSTYAEFKLFNCAAPALNLPDDFPVVAYTTDDGSTLRLPIKEFPHPDEIFLVRVEDEWATPRVDRTTFELSGNASDSDSDDSPMPALEPDSPRPTIVLVPAEPWLLPAMTAFDEDRATPADRALLAFGNMYADVKYWATRNPASQCNNCIAICDATAAYAAAVYTAAPPPPPPPSSHAPKPMSVGEKAKVDAIMASHRIVSLMPRDSTPRPAGSSAAEMRKAKVDAIMATNPTLRASLLTPADADPRALTKEDVHPAVAAFTPSAIRLQRWFRETKQAKVDAIMATAPALFASLTTPADADPSARTKEDGHLIVAKFAPSDTAHLSHWSQAPTGEGMWPNDDSNSVPSSVLDRFCVRLADTEGMPDLVVMPAAASEPRAEDEEAPPSLPVN